MENTSEFYYEKLKSSTNPGPILASLLCILYDKEVSRSEVIMCNKLVKVFGRFTTFFSIIDMAGSYPDYPENPYPLLYTICKRKFEAVHNGVTTQARESLDGYIANIEREIEKMKKQKLRIPSSKGLDQNE